MNNVKVPIGKIGDESPESYYQPALNVGNYSGLKIIASKTLAHYRHAVLNPTPDDQASASLAFGKAWHCALLEPDQFVRRYSLLPANAPQRPTSAMLNAKNNSPESAARISWWQEWEASNAGRTILSAATYDAVNGMTDAVRAHPVGRDLIEGGLREQTIRWVDEDTGLECKARLDILHEDAQIAADPKSVVDAHPRAWERAVLSFDYHLQHVHYCEGMRAIGRPLRHFLHLIVEKEPPYVVAVRQISPAFEELAYARWRRAMRLLTDAVRTDRWPGYGDGIELTDMPPYAFYTEPKEDNA